MHRTTVAAVAVSAAALATVLSSTTALASADAAPQHAPARAGAYQVTVKVKDTEPLVHTRVKIKGTVSPAGPGSRLTVQVKYQDRKTWKSIGNATVTGAGKYRFTDKVNSVRERRYRVVMPATGHRGTGRATTTKVTVFGWRNLDSVTPLPGGMLVKHPATINAKAYPHSLTGTLAPGRVDYNLNRDCKELDAVYGIDDSSQLGASATLSVLADGTTKHSGSYVLTQTEHAVTDLNGVFRLSLTSSQSGGAEAAFGTPRVLCSF